MIVDDVLYLGGTDGALHGLNPLTGAELFSTKVSNSPLVSLTIVSEVVYAATAGGALVALSLSTRATRWTYQFGVPVTLSAVTNVAAYAVTQYQHRVIAIRLSDRAVLWTHDIEPRANLSGLAYVDQGSEPLVPVTTDCPQLDGLPGGVVGVGALDAMTGAFVCLGDRSAEVGGAGWASAPTVGWARSSNPGEYRQDDHYSKTPDAFVRFPFRQRFFVTGSPWHRSTE